MKTFLLSFLLLTGQLAAQVKDGDARTKIAGILSQLPSSAKTAVMVYDPDTEDTIYAYNPAESMIPASNTKIFTTATAFSLLGNNWIFMTKLLTDDQDLDSTVINGNLYIKGYGNSLFTDSNLDSLVKDLKAKGVKKITGNIIGDDSYCDNIYSREDWITDEHANVSVPPVSALVINRNTIIVQLYANKTNGSLVDAKVFPECSFIKLNVTARATKSRSNPKIKFSTEGNKIVINVSGAMRIRKYPRSYAVYVEDPPLFAANLLHDRLIKNGITVNGHAETGVTPQNAVEINYAGTSITNLIAHTNKHSDNFLAECLFKVIGAEYSGKQGNSFYATQAVLRFIKDNNIFDEGTAVVDGSGISRYNEITVGAITGVLETMYLNPDLYQNYYSTMAIAGVDGTLEDRMRSGYAKNNFHGKTGTLNGVSALSGYLTTKGNRDLIVCIIMEFKSYGANFYRGIQDKIIDYLSEEM